MSEGGVIVISSDEDPDSFKLSEEKECIYNTNAAQTSAEKLQSNGANQISFIDLAKSSVNTALKGKETCINQSDNFYTMASETDVSYESSDAIENDFYGSDSESFKKFISVVLPAEPDEYDRAKIVKKLDKYFKLANPSYIKSPEFSELLEKGIKRIMEDSVNLYFVLRDVKDSLLSSTVEYRSLKNLEDKLLNSRENAPGRSAQGSSSGSESLSDEVKEERKRKIVNKLTLLLKKVYEKIKQLEELEVDFSDEEDSTYFKMQKYRERFCQVYDKLCDYTNQPLDGNRVGGFRRINFSDTDNLELNRAIEKWLNKTKQFPDYYDVNKFMIELNQTLNLKLTKEQVKIKAQQIFEKIGNMLQRRRHFDLWDSLSSFLNTDADPAVKNPELESLLQKNYELGMKKEKELIRYYAEKQEREQLQPLEVPEEEANCSPVESGDEDEEEIEIVENILDSKISSDDDDYSENDSDHVPCGFSYFATRSKSYSKRGAQSETRVENNNPEKISVSNKNSEQIDDAGSSKVIDSDVGVNSEQTETVGTNIRAIPVKDENEVGATPNKQDAEDNLVICKPENLMKRKNENGNENDNDNVNTHPCKRFLEEKEMTEANNVEETNITEKGDSDSDCEIIEIISNKKDETNKDPSSKRKVYQVNYAFINNTFNYNTVLSNNILTKRHCFPSNYKNMKNQKSLNDNPPDDSTNIKSITSKNALYRENKLKRKMKNFCNKPKVINSITWQAAKDSDSKNNHSATSTGTTYINCPLKPEKNSGNMKSQKEVNKTNQNNDLQEGSSNGTAAPPTGGSSSGGDGQGNGENNGNKKPFDRETQTEDNPENEDKEEDEEEEEDTPEEKSRGIPKVTETVPKLIFSRTYQKGKKIPGSAVLKLPPTEKFIPVRRNSTGKQSDKPPGSETAQGKEQLDLPLAAIALRARQASARKRKMNQNGGMQGTSRQGSAFNFQFHKGTAEPKKPKVNKAIPTTSSARDDDVEIIQVNKKKRPTPVKPVRSDEEIVKNFLERSHPSISITTPKKKAVQREPPPSVRQALETLSRLKGISTTIVKGSSKQNTDEEVTIIGETLNTRVNKICKQQKIPAPSATATASSELLLPKIPAPSATATTSSEPLLSKIPAPSATATTSSELLLPKIQAPSATATTSSEPLLVKLPTPSATATSSEPLLPKIVTVQGNVSGFEIKVDNHTALQDHLYHSLAQSPQTASVNVSGTASNYNEQFYSPQARLANVSGTTSNYNEQFYSPQARLAYISGTTSNYSEQFYGPQAPAASVSGSASTYEEQFHSPQATATSVSGSASTYQEQFYGPQASAATMSGSASTYEENFTGTVECIPIPRFRNVKSRSRRTPKKTKDIEYVIID